MQAPSGQLDENRCFSGIESELLSKLIMNNRGFPSHFRPLLWTLTAIVGLTGASGQTLINLSTQGKNVDFTNAPYTRPLKTGTSLPATCTTGDMYLNLSGAVGKNLYACTATNTWTQQSGGTAGLADPGANGVVVRTAQNVTTAVTAPNGTIVGTTDTQTLTNKSIDASEINTGVFAAARMPALSGDVSTSAGSTATALATVNSTPGTFGGSSLVPVITVNGKGLVTSVTTAAVASGGGGGGGGASTSSQLLDFSPTLSGASVAFGSACTSSTPCTIYLNNTRFSYTNSVTVSVSGSAADTMYVYVDVAGNRTAGYGSANTYTSTSMAIVSGVTAFPSGTFPLYQCVVSGGAITSCTDYRPILSKTTFAAGAGTSISTNANGTAVNVVQTVDYVSNVNYTVPGSVCGHYEIATNASSGVWGLPTPSAGGMVTNGCTIAFRATTASIILTPTNATINGGSNYVIAPGQYCSVVSDGTNYQVGQCSGTYVAPVRGIGYVFDGGGNPLAVGKTGYYTVPYSCVVNSWNMTVDSGTATVDVWKVATGTSVPTAANTITGTASPSLSAGTAVHSTTLTGWTTNVAPNDVFAFNIKAVSGATLISLVLACQ